MDVKYVLESNSNFNQMLDNGLCHGGGLHKTWSTPYLNNNEESKEFDDEKSNEQYLNLLNMTNPWPSNSLSSNIACNTFASSSNSNSLLKDAINNNIEKSWSMSLKGLSKKQIKQVGTESDQRNDNEQSQNNLKTNKKDNAFYSKAKEYNVLNSSILELENAKERKNSNSSLPTFLLSTNLESLSPITISLTDLSFGGNSVSPSFPSDKLVYLDSPIRITIMGSHQVGKSALAVRYLSRQECLSRSSAAPSMHGMKQKLTKHFVPSLHEYTPNE